MRIVATDRVPPAARQAFAQLGEIEVRTGAGAVADAEVLIVRSGRVDAAFLECSNRLRVIARTGAGVDGIDLAAASRRSLPVVFAPEAGVLPVAEGALALILATAKRMGELGELVRSGRWADRYEVEGLDLRGATLGVIGLGRIGREVARLAVAVGMKVIAFEPSPRAGVADPLVELVSLHDLAARADIVTLHCDLNDATRGMVNRELVARLKQGTILVNAARGGVVESDEILLDALRTGRLAAVGLDVFANEPPDPHLALLNDPRVISTPHSIGLTRQWNERVFGTLAEGVQAILRGERPAHIANPEVLSAQPAQLDVKHA